MNSNFPLLPNLAVNRSFMQEFVDAQSPCAALGLVEVDNLRYGLIALQPNEPIPSAISAEGFAFGHCLLGTSDMEIVQFSFDFYEFKTYHMLINPSNLAAKAVLEIMVNDGQYFILILDSQSSVTTFRADISPDVLSGLKANWSRIESSTTADTDYRLAYKTFSANPEPEGTMLTWLSMDDLDYLDLKDDRLVLRPK